MELSKADGLARKLCRRNNTYVVLEHKSLLLLPWSKVRRSPSGSGGPEAVLHQREILDAITGLGLGHACCSVRAGKGVLGWFVTPAMTVSVHESEDDSLLFTMQGLRRFSLWRRYRRRQEIANLASERYWEVRDADEHAVGNVQLNGGPSLPPLQMPGNADPSTLVVAYDRFWRPFVLVAGSDGTDRRFWGTGLSREAWTELGQLSRVSGGIVLDFSTQLEGQPFNKMLLLAEALITEWSEP